MPLTPWREIVTPHRDIATGRYHQAEFAANLGEVIAGNADTEYQDPIEFFARTYLTAGMQRLLATAVRVCKVFGTQFVTPFSNASNIALRWSARKDTGFSIDMLLRWSKEVSLQVRTYAEMR